MVAMYKIPNMVVGVSEQCAQNNVMNKSLFISFMIFRLGSDLDDPTEANERTKKTFIPLFMLQPLLLSAQVNNNNNNNNKNNNNDDDDDDDAFFQKRFLPLLYYIDSFIKPLPSHFSLEFL